MIRVLRLMEYRYANNEVAENDMARWQIPANGTRNHGPITIKSAIITDLNFESKDDTSS